jgi:hypothetical protein
MWLSAYRETPVTNSTTSYDSAYQQGIRDGLSGVPPTPLSGPANPNVTDAYRQGREKGEKGNKSDK